MQTSAYHSGPSVELGNNHHGGPARDFAIAALPEICNDEGLELLAHTLADICQVAANVLGGDTASPSDKVEARRLVEELAIAVLALSSPAYSFQNEQEHGAPGLALVGGNEE